MRTPNRRDAMPTLIKIYNPRQPELHITVRSNNWKGWESAGYLRFNGNHRDP